MNSKRTARYRRHNRIRMRSYGTGEKPRVVVYRSLRATYVQAIDDAAQKVVVAASDLKLKLTGSPVERAKAVGKNLGELLAGKSVTTITFDRGGYRYHGRTRAVAEGMREAGIKF